MRKYLIGILIGMALTISSSVFAEDIKTLIGVKVQGEFPVKINGETLEKPAIVINGISYLPNRSIADALGMDIKFDSDLGIELKSKEVIMTTPEVIANDSVNSEIPDRVYTQDEIDLNIRTYNTFIGMLQIQIDTVPDDLKVEERKVQLRQYQDELVIWEARKAALQ